MSADSDVPGQIASWLLAPMDSGATLRCYAECRIVLLSPIASDVPGQTKKVLRSNVPWIILGLLYAYLLALSWTPLTLPSMFSSKYWLPEVRAWCYCPSLGCIP